MLKPLVARWLGRVPYTEGLRLQEELVAARRREETPDTLLLLEHPPVITLGRGADPANVRISKKTREAQGIELWETGRGGDVTFHGPGQLVGYPVIALVTGRRDAHRYLRDLEAALILTVAEFGVLATRLAGLTGIWAEGRKLGAIGVRISTGWITSHGFALNVNTDLGAFGAIIPCGIADRGVTSLAELTGRSFSLSDVASRAALRTAQVLGFAAEPREGTSWEA